MAARPDGQPLGHRLGDAEHPGEQGGEHRPGDACHHHGGGGDAGGGHGTGVSWWNTPEVCKILCSELRNWSVCRSAAQIQNNMTTTSARSEGLVAYWRMNEGSGEVFEDCTGNGHTLRAQVAPAGWIEGVKSTDTATPWL